MEIDQINQSIIVLRDKITDFLKDGKKKLTQRELKELHKMNKELLNLINMNISWSFIYKKPIKFRMGNKLLTYLKGLTFQPQYKEFYGQINLAKMGREYQIITRIGFDHFSEFFSMLRGEIFFHSHPYKSPWGKYSFRPYSPPSSSDIVASYETIIRLRLWVQKELVITPEGIYIIEPKDAKAFIKKPVILNKDDKFASTIEDELKPILREIFNEFYDKIYPKYLKKSQNAKNDKEYLKVANALSEAIEKHASKSVKKYNDLADKHKLQIRLVYYPWAKARKNMEYFLEDLIPLGAQPRGTMGIYGISEQEFEGYSQTRPRGGGALVQLVSS